jgi:plasmid stability protein
MGVITIADVDEELEQRLRQLAVQHGRTPEEEARHILGDALAASAKGSDADNVGLAIRAIARSRGMAWATRNTADFEAVGVDLIDPWRG